MGLGTLDASTGSNLHGGARGTGSGSFAITDGTGAPEIRVTAGAATVEGMAAKFTVRSSATSTRSLRVNLSAAQSGSFVASAELGAGKSVVIPAGETSAMYSVPTLADGVDEANGAVTLTVASGTGYSVSSTAGSASVTVTDDDSTTVTLASSDTTATEGSTTETGAFTVALGRVLVSGESLRVPLTASGEIDTEYTLELAVASGIALSNNRELTFTGGASAARAAIVSYRAHADPDPNSETVRFSIPGSTSGSPRMTATGLGGGVVGSGSALVVVTDTGQSGRGSVTVQPTSLTVAEGGSRAYRMALGTDPGSGATVVITPASNNTDVTFSPASLSFTGGADGNWSTWQSVTVATAEDADTTADSATLSHTITGYAGVTSVQNVSVTVTEAGAGFLVSAARVDVVAGQTVDYTVRLKSQPAGNVVLDLTSGDTSIATVPSSVTIPPANWQSGVAVTVTGVAAGVASISHAHATTTDSGYASATLPGNMAVNVFAAAPPEITVESNHNANGVNEGVDASFQLNVSPRPASDLVVSFTVEENGDFASGALPTSATISANTISTAVVIPTTRDSTDEPDGSFILTLQPGADYRLGGAASATVPVVDSGATTVELRSGSTTIPETGGTHAFTVQLGRTLVAGESVSAPLSLTGSATLVTDYRLNPLAGSSGVRFTGLATQSPTIAFTGGPNSAKSATVSVVAVSDLLDENDETVIVTLRTPTHTGLGGGASSTGATTANFRIVDDDGDAASTVSIAPGSGVTEGTAASFTVSVSPALGADASNLTVNLNVGQMGDYVASADLGMKQVTIIAGSGSATYTVPTAGDNQDEAAGSVTVNVDPGGGYQVSGSSASASVAVADNDDTGVTLSAAAGDISEASGAKEIKLTLGRALVSGESLTQRLSFGGSATFGTDYTLAATTTLPSGVSFNNLASNNLSASPPTVVFTGGTGASRVATLTLTATQDTTVESGGETITVNRGTTAQTGLGGVDRKRLGGEFPDRRRRQRRRAAGIEHRRRQRRHRGRERRLHHHLDPGRAIERTAGDLHPVPTGRVRRLRRRRFGQDRHHPRAARTSVIHTHRHDRRQRG